MVPPRPDQRNVTTLNTTVPPSYRDSVVSLFFVNDEVVVVLVGVFFYRSEKKKELRYIADTTTMLMFCVCVCVFSVHFLYDHHTEIDNVIGTMYRITESKEIEWAIPRRYRSYASHL